MALNISQVDEPPVAFADLLPERVYTPLSLGRRPRALNPGIFFIVKKRLTKNALSVNLLTNIGGPMRILDSPSSMLGPDYADVTFQLYKIVGAPEPIPVVNVAVNQEAMVSYEPVKEHEIMVDFHNERDTYHRYMTEAVYDRLPIKKSPYTTRPILPNEVTRYIAHLDPSLEPHPLRSGGRRRRTRKTRRRRTTRRS